MISDSLQLPLDLGHYPDFTLENLLIAPCNEQAISMVMRWPEWPMPMMVIYGPRRSGKTHIARVWAHQSQAVWLEADDLTEACLSQFTEKLEQPIILENADLIADERLLFHLCNIVRAQGQTFLMTAASAPAHWGISLKDLSSRLRAAAAIPIGVPDDDLIGMMLLKHFMDRQLNIGPEVTQFLIPRVERSFEYLDHIVREIDEKALSVQRKITVPFVREILLNLEREFDSEKEEKKWI